MAVQAHYGSNILLLNRSEQEKKEMDSSPQAATRDGGETKLTPSWCFHLFSLRWRWVCCWAANKEARKRGREAAGVPMAPSPSPPPQQQKQSRLLSFLSMKPQPCSPAPVSIAELQMHPPSQVSPGLRLTAEEKRRHRRETQSNPLLSSASSSSVLHEELVALVNHQRDEIETLLIAQEEQLRRALAERWQRHYRALLNAAEESAARRLREKEAEVGRLARRRGELENRLALLRTETMAWQAKAMADQVTAAALNAQLEKAAAAPERKEISGDSPPAEDAESGFEDPDRVERERACRSCQYRQASVVLLPCRHLCLCDACDAASDSCPVCRCVTTGSVRVLLS